MLKKSLILIFIFIFASSISFAAKDTAASTKEIEWAAKVNGKIIPMQKFNKAINFAKKQALKGKKEGTKLPSEEAKEMGRSLLEQLIESEIITQWANRSRIIVKEGEIKWKISEMKKKFPSNYEFHKSLAKRGMSVDDLKKSVARELIIAKVIKIKLKEQIVSDEEIKAFYDKNIELYVQKGKIHLKQILLDSRETANKVIEKIKEGEKFEDIAKRMSVDEESKTDGGDLGIIEEGALAKEVEEFVFKLVPKIVSDVFATEKGFYIFKVEEKFPSQEIKYEDAKENIRRFLINEKARSAYLKRLDEEKENSTIILNEKLKHLFI